MVKSRIFDRVTAEALWQGGGNIAREGARRTYLGTHREELPGRKDWGANSFAVGVGKGGSAWGGGRDGKSKERTEQQA